MDFKDIRVTYNRNLYKVNDCRSMSLHDALEMVRCDKFIKDTVERHRSMLSVPGYDGHVKKELPKALMEGEYTQRKGDALVRYNGLLMVDADEVSDIDYFIEVLVKATRPAFLFRSVSDGVKFAFLTDLDDVSLHRHAFDIVAEQIKGVLDPIIKLDHLSFHLDYVGPAVGTFLSHDPALYRDEDAVVLPLREMCLQRKAESEMRAQAARKRYESMGVRTKGGEEEEAMRLHAFLLRTGCSVTYDYQDWVKTAFALFSVFDHDTAMRLFHLFSSLDGDKYDVRATDRKGAEVARQLERTPDKRHSGLGHIYRLGRMQGFEPGEPERALTPCLVEVYADPAAGSVAASHREVHSEAAPLRRKGVGYRRFEMVRTYGAFMRVVDTEVSEVPEEDYGRPIRTGEGGNPSSWGWRFYCNREDVAAHKRNLSAELRRRMERTLPLLEGIRSRLPGPPEGLPERGLCALLLHFDAPSRSFLWEVSCLDPQGARLRKGVLKWEGEGISLPLSDMGSPFDEHPPHSGFSAWRLRFVGPAAAASGAASAMLDRVARTLDEETGLVRRVCLSTAAGSSTPRP